MFTDIISYYFVIRIRKDIFLSYVFIFELGLLKLHSVERRSGFFLRRVCYLHMRGDRFFSVLSHLVWGLSSFTDIAEYVFCLLGEIVVKTMCSREKMSKGRIHES